MSELKTYLAEEIEANQPPGAPDFAVISSRASRRRVRRRALIAVASAAAVTAMAFGASSVLGDDEPTLARDPTTGPGPTVGPSTGPESPGGELPFSGQFSCVERYTPDAVGARGFAFDGTVVEISRRDAAGTSTESLGYWLVTFELEEWFSGESRPERVVTSMAPPMPASDGRPPSYDIGTRLLVSGEYDAAGSAGDAMLVWGCGFTRYYDTETAAAWREAIGG